MNFPFKTNLPGVHQESDGRIALDITPEEEESTQRYFNIFNEPGKQVVVPTEVKTMLNGMALYNYAMEEYGIVTHADRLEPEEYKDIMLKIAAAMMKAYTFLPKSIFLFDLASILEKINEKETANNFYNLFLEKNKEDGGDQSDVKNSIFNKCADEIRAVHGLPDLETAKKAASRI